MVNSPESFEVVLYFTLVSLWTAVTKALGTIAPPGSVTEPAMVPRSSCAFRTVNGRANKSSRVAHFDMGQTSLGSTKGAEGYQSLQPIEGKICLVCTIYKV